MLRPDEQAGVFYARKQMATEHAVHVHFLACMCARRYDNGIKKSSCKERICEPERGVDMMTGRRLYRAAAALLLTLSVAVLAGCRETPEESAVASRAGGTAGGCGHPAACGREDADHRTAG